MGEGLVTLHGTPQLKDSTLVVSWADDAGGIGTGLHNYLVRQLKCALFAEIEPAPFFPLNGVRIENDVAQFPRSEFYSGEGNVTLFKSNGPAWEWHAFLNTVLDVAQQRCQVRQVLTVGGILSIAAHTSPRQLFAVGNSPNTLRNLGKYSVEGIDHQTQTGQRPSMSSYLLWAAQRRGIPGASLWVGVPFYLATADDPSAWLQVLPLLRDMLGIKLDISELSTRAESLDRRIAEARGHHPDIDQYLQKLEGNIGLSQEESEKLAGEMQEILRWQ